MKTDIKKELPGIKKDVPLKGYSTYKIGGKARYFFEAKNKEDLIMAIKAARKFKLPYFILAGGSNILFSDSGYKGLVIKIKFQNVKVKDSEIYVEAGVSLNDLVSISTSHNLTGFEWAAGIPGATLGGSIFGNAQAFGDRISDSVKSAEVLDIGTLKIRKFTNKQCGFKSKTSVFKSKGNLIITSAVLKLKKGKLSEIKETVKEHLEYRKKMHPLKYPSAGSVFVNPEIKIKDKKILKKFPDLVEFNKKGFIHSGYLIDMCGLKGKKCGRAQISEQHANFIINLGGAKAKDVICLINLAKKSVFRKFKIKLGEEIRIVK
ncbi:MAG: UDP-N-acetylmuramate dehydrogenase [Candidatus Nealsonbacteria bacterium]|nr:UDP-N-acetylmuramate dehydrogenase [Candidatus Nealsonbacteria bacterium]